MAPQIGWKSPQNTSRCDVNDDKYYALFSAAVSFYIPLLIIVVVYYRIYKEAKAQMKFLKTGTKQSKSKDNPGSEITLRVHIGPTKTAKSQFCECKSELSDANKIKINEELNMSLLKSKNLYQNGVSSSYSLKYHESNALGTSCNQAKENSKFLLSPNFSNIRASSESSLNYTLNLRPIESGLCKNCRFDIKKSVSTDVLQKATTIGNIVSTTTIYSKLAKFKKEQKAAKTLAIVVGMLHFFV